MPIFVLCCYNEYSFQKIMTKSKQKEKKFPAIILSAGFSSRMGEQKLFLPFGSGETFLSRLISVYENYGCAEIVVVANEKGVERIEKSPDLARNVKLVCNNHPEWTKFYSLQLACRELYEFEAAFVQNIDNPYTNKEVLSVLEKAFGRADYILPEYINKGGHPFLISSNVIHQISAHYNHQEHLKQFLKQFKYLRIPVQDRQILANINTPEAYQEWFKRPLKMDHT